MHPWERDARLAHHVIHRDHPSVILIEISCTRAAEELLGARRAYHALFHHSLEEDAAHHVQGPVGDVGTPCHRPLLLRLPPRWVWKRDKETDPCWCCLPWRMQLLVRLASAYRYEGPHLHESTAKAEAKVLGDAVKSGKKPIENEEVIRILTTRSTAHLRVTFKHYKDTYGKPLAEVWSSPPYPSLHLLIRLWC